jgi:hypothetical protein
MVEPELNLPPDEESITANRRRTCLLLRFAAFLALLAIASGALYYFFAFSQLLSLLVAIFGVTCLGLAAFSILAILWRRVCAWRGHVFCQIDVFPDGRITVYECRHCGEQRYVPVEPPEMPNHSVNS